MFKRVLATVLTILMLLSVIPATLASAATIPGSLIQPSYYMDDNNDVRWYYFELSGWYFWYGYGYSDSMTDYAALNPGASAPTNGYIYVYGTGAHLGAAKYTTEDGWVITGTTGQGGGTVALKNCTLRDNNGAIWKYMGGTWVYVINAMSGTTGGLLEYRVKYGVNPRYGTVEKSNGEVYCDAVFDDETGSWNLSYNGGFGQVTAGYSIFDGRATWSVMSGEWIFVAILFNGQRISGDADDYYEQFGEYPTTGTATDAQDNFISYCRFDEETKSWRSVSSTGTGTTSYAYIIDNNGKCWVSISNIWYYIKSDNAYGTIGEYWDAYKELPRTGTAYTAQDKPVASCTYDFETGTWMVGSTGTDLLYSYYLLDNLGVYWYYRNNAWCFATDTNSSGLGTVSQYLIIYGELPVSGKLYKSTDDTFVGVYLFDTDTYTWEPYGDSVIPDWNNPGSSGGSSSGSGSVSDSYYSGQLANPNTAHKVYDTKNRLWTKNGSTWSSLYSSYYTVANPARYIDSTNRVWEMRNGRWSLNERAEPGEDEVTVPTTPSAVNPNNLSTLTDTKGYTWTKSGSVWTSTASSYYKVLNVTPQYKANDNSTWGLNSSRTTWTKTSGGSQTPSEPSTPTIPESVAGYTAYVFDGKTYQVPNHTIEIVPGPTTMPYKPEGYNWITHGGKYTLMNLNTGDIYPIPTLYQLPNNYYYQPTYDKENPWKIVGNGTFANSTITSIELTDYPYKLEVGKTYQCKAEYVGGSKVQSLSTILIWSSTNPEVATVDQTGKVTIVGVGRADIKVRAFLGFVETKIDIYGIEAENKPEDKPSTPVTPPDEPVTPPVVTTPVSDIFSDVSANAPYTEYIQYVYDNDIFKGMSETTFGPESTMTRAQFYTVLARMAGYTDEELKAKYPSTKFADSQDKWFTAAVEWAYTEGLDGGVGAMQIADANGQLVWVDNCFNPDGAIKREDACAALYNFAKKYNKAAYAQLVQQPYNISFADASEVNWWAQAAVSSFSQLGILSGHIIDSGNNFRPEDPSTRSDIATIIARYGMLYMK